MAQKTDLGTEPFRVGRHLHKCVGHTTEQQVVEFDRIGLDECVQLMGEREHDMKIGNL